MEFRELLLYCLDGKIDPSDLLHRTQLSEVIAEKFRERFSALKHALKVPFLLRIDGP